MIITKSLHKYILPVILFSFLYVSISYTEEYHSNPKLLDWIPATCCVTNDCCWEISSSEIRELPDQKAEVKSTGQVRPYMFSKDDKFYRCACDYDEETKQWIKHQGANTRCLFVPNRGS